MIRILFCITEQRIGFKFFCSRFFPELLSLQLIYFHHQYLLIYCQQGTAFFDQYGSLDGIRNGRECVYDFLNHIGSLERIVAGIGKKQFNLESNEILLVIANKITERGTPVLMKK